MSSSDELNGAGKHPSDQPNICMHAEVSGHGQATIAARDIHVHYEDAARLTRRVESDRLVEECPYPGLAPFTAEQA
ncbi:MAG: hypothetical protein LC799_28450, partial [Actinobacteria bacterium]|nr:hypothetical protein [Actinomycetota bacterium]